MAGSLGCGPAMLPHAPITDPSRIGSVVVTKSLTAEQDANAIGSEGAVNLTRTALWTMHFRL